MQPLCERVLRQRELNPCRPEAKIAIRVLLGRKSKEHGKDLDQYAYTSVISAFADKANTTAAKDP